MSECGAGERAGVGAMLERAARQEKGLEAQLKEQRRGGKEPAEEKELAREREEREAKEMEVLMKQVDADFVAMVQGRESAE